MAGEARALWSWRSDPTVPDFPDEHPLIVFDGECVLCCRSAQLVLKHDRARTFRLTTAQGRLGQALYRHFGLSHGTRGTMLLLAHGRLFTHGDAAIGIAERLGRPFRMAAAARLVPPRLRNPLYRMVARSRFRMFGRRATCWVPTPDIADRIL
jgi:predicted DCC family thiol-disulfide oxidoreductase YuxK